jgi:hypothetical protein
MILLSEFEFAPTRKHRGVLRRDLELDLCMGFTGQHEFYHKATCWGRANDDHLTILAGYASDLCSPGFWLFGKWRGTYSQGMELEAFLHDFLRQFMRPGLPCSPWGRKTTDDLFYNAGKMRKSKLIPTYHAFVASPIGSAWIALNRARPDVSCRCCAPLPLP